MSDTVIQAENVSKLYRLGEVGTGSLKDDLNRWWHRLRGKGDPYAKIGEINDRTRGSENEWVWALKDINFSLKRGEVLGIIGRNGAGKSTLLKLLSRVTAPTSGAIKIKGRIASLLEVGTGFHPDLTGRENIYLNGAILGMKREEIRRNFDAIVAFAEVERYIDTPVKRYSSGMYVRLAFAVAAHLQPEILIVDEVLAVGDIQFQRKCLGKMDEVSKREGRTILFVSHNTNAVEKLCNRCLWLTNGEVAEDSRDVGEVLRRYTTQTSATRSAEWRNLGDEWRNEWFKPLRISVCTPEDSSTRYSHTHRDDVRLVVEGEVLCPNEGLQIGLGVFAASGDLLFWSTIRDVREEEWHSLEEGPVRLECRIPSGTLNLGTYRADLFLGIYHREWICEPGTNVPSVHFEVDGGLDQSPFWIEPRPGILAPVLNWTVIH